MLGCREFAIVVVLAGSIQLLAHPADAILLDANVSGVFSDTTFVTPTDTVLVGGDAYHDISVGNGVIVSVDISNPDEDSVQAIFAALSVDPSRLSYLGGSFSSGILCDSPPFCSAELGPVQSPAPKSDDSSGFEIIAAAFSNSNPTTGAGPEIGAAQLFFEVVDTTDPISIDIDIASGNGIWIDGLVVDETNQASHTALVQFAPATIYVPEPSRFALLGTGLVGLAFLSRNRGANRRRRVLGSAHALGVSFVRLGLVLAVLLFAMPSDAQDADGDGVLDAQDNCIEVANPTQEDADQDGFGTVCDGDFNQDGYVLGLDVIYWFQNCFNQATLAVCDITGVPGQGGSAAAATVLFGPLWNLPVGPSGWSCATIPPVDVSMGDPACLGP